MIYDCYQPRCIRHGFHAPDEKVSFKDKNNTPRVSRGAVFYTGWYVVEIIDSDVKQ